MITSWKYKGRVFSYAEERRLPELVRILHDPDVEEYLWFAPITLEGLRGYMLPILEGGKAALRRGAYPVSAAFTVAEDGEMLGMCALVEMPDAHNAALIGYQLRRSAWGRGVGTSCLEFLLHYAKTYVTVRKLFGDCVSANVASARIMEKCGFSLEGVLREKYEFDGVLHDNSWFGLAMADVSPLSEGAVEEMP